MEKAYKLPVWAQEEIRNLERERDNAIKALNDALNHQTESPIFYWDYVSTGENQGPTQKTFYIQTRRIEINHAGVEVSILLRDDHIYISWGGHNRKDAAFIPSSYQAAHIVSKENMR